MDCVVVRDIEVIDGLESQLGVINEGVLEDDFLFEVVNFVFLGCGDLFVCKQKIYKNVTSTAFYLKTIAKTLKANDGDEDMPLDDTPYHVLSACVHALEKTRPSVIVPSLLKCVERFAQTVKMKKNEWDARRHYAAKNYGAAFGHVEQMNKISQQNTKWFDTQTQNTHPWTEELRAICKSLRIPEVTEPVPHRDVNLHD